MITDKNQTAINLNTASVITYFYLYINLSYYSHSQLDRQREVSHDQSCELVQKRSSAYHDWTAWLSLKNIIIFKRLVNAEEAEE